ncbi:MAG: hypothetical protein Q9160_008092 [Pyrenula sp. 1 TL-2023]
MPLRKSAPPLNDSALAMQPAFGSQDPSVPRPTTPIIQRPTEPATEIDCPAAKLEKEAQKKPSKAEETEKENVKPRRPAHLRIKIPLDAGPPRPPSRASASPIPKSVMTDKLRMRPGSKEFWDVLYALYWEPEDDLPREEWRAS